MSLQSIVMLINFKVRL